MKYKIQLISFDINGSTVSHGDDIEIGSFNKLPVKLVMSQINALKSDIASLNLACGLLPGTIEANRLRVAILVTNDSDDPICYSQLYEYRQS